MQSVGILIDTVIWIFTWVLIINIALGWLIHFNIVNASQPFVRGLGEITYKITEPALRPIRRVIPSVGGLDLSPIVLILLLQFARNLMWEYVIT
jgi:YggT family protein